MPSANDAAAATIKIIRVVSQQASQTNLYSGEHTKRVNMFDDK